MLANLEGCRAALVRNGDRDTAQLLSVAILGLRTKLSGIDESELKALCDAMLRDDEASFVEPEPQDPLQQRSGVSLKLVK